MADEQKMTKEERYESRKGLLQFLLIVLVLVGIGYFSFELAMGVLGFFVWLFMRGGA